MSIFLNGKRVRGTDKEVYQALVAPGMPAHFGFGTGPYPVCARCAVSRARRVEPATLALTTQFPKSKRPNRCFDCQLEG